MHVMVISKVRFRVYGYEGVSVIIGRQIFNIFHFEYSFCWCGMPFLIPLLALADDIIFFSQPILWAFLFLPNTLPQRNKNSRNIDVERLHLIRKPLTPAYTAQPNVLEPI